MGHLTPPPKKGLNPQFENTALDVLVTSLLGAHWKGQDNMKKDLYSMLITVLFTKAKAGATKVSIYEWTKKTWLKYKTKYYSFVKMIKIMSFVGYVWNEDILLISQAQENMPNFSLLCGTEENSNNRHESTGKLRGGLLNGFKKNS